MQSPQRTSLPAPPLMVSAPAEPTIILALASPVSVSSLSDPKRFSKLAALPELSVYVFADEAPQFTVLNASQSEPRPPSKEVSLASELMIKKSSPAPISISSAARASLA